MNDLTMQLKLTTRHRKRVALAGAVTAAIASVALGVGVAGSASHEPPPSRPPQFTPVPPAAADSAERGVMTHEVIDQIIQQRGLSPEEGKALRERSEKARGGLSQIRPTPLETRDRQNTR